jgi:hypothetical protein
MTVATHTGKADFSALLGNGVRAALHGRPASVGIAVGNLSQLRRNRITIIYVTGNPGQVPNGFIDTNETQLLAKPFEVDTLLATVKAVLRQAVPLPPAGAAESTHIATSMPP